MVYKFKAKNYRRAFGFFHEVPFYSLKDFLFKRDLLIKASDIQYVEKMALGKRPPKYSLYIKNEKHEGLISIRNGEIGSFSHYEMREVSSDKVFWELLNFLSFESLLRSPLTYTLLLSLLSYLIFIEGKSTLFPEILSPAGYVNAYCNVTCVKGAGLIFWVMSFLVFNVFGSFFIALAFLINSKKIRKIDLYQKTIKESLILLVVQGILVYQMIFLAFDQGIFKSAHFIYQRRYNPDYFKTHNYREISSQIKQELDLIKTKE